MPPSKTWRTEAVILFLTGQFFCFFAGAIVIALFHKFGVYGFKKDDAAGVIILSTLCFQGATWLLIPFFLWFHGVRFCDEFGLHRKNSIGSIALAAATLLVILPIALKFEQISQLLLERLGWHLHEEEAVTLISGAKTLPMKIYLGFFAVIMAPVAEEFIFRGVLYPFIKQFGFPKLALFGTSALFAAIHGNAAIFVSLFVLALAFAWLYEKTGNLLAPVCAHSLFNGVNLVILTYQDQIEDWLQQSSHHA